MASDPDGADPEAELDRQARVLAEKALEKLPEAARALKLPKVKEGILKRLREQAQAAGAQQAFPAAIPGATPPAAAAAAADPAAAAREQPPGQPPPPPPPPEKAEEEERPLQLEGVEACGDEPWFADAKVRGALRASVAAAHAEQKILVGAPAEEIRRICPGGGRVLGAGAVLRLGGAHFGGFGESDIAYAYRQLSRAIHPDKNLDVPEAPDAFKRLSDAAEELRQGLGEARASLQVICASLGRAPPPGILERPQEALFAEATRLLTAVLSLAGEGEVSDAAAERGMVAFASSQHFSMCSGTELLRAWFERPELLQLFAGPVLRAAYDCAPKRFRAQYLCLLNRTLLAEAKRHNDCVRGLWQEVMAQFPELHLWRELRERLMERVWKIEEAEEGAAAEIKPLPRPKRPPKPKPEPVAEPKEDFDDAGVAGKKEDPVCWNWATTGFCRASERCRYLHHFPPGYDVSKASEAIKRQGQLPSRRPAVIPPKVKEAAAALAKAIEEKPKERPKTSRWAKWWRDLMEAVLPASLESGTPPGSDPEVRRLCFMLWSDVAAWASGAGLEQSLGLFRAEPSGRFDPDKGIHPIEAPIWGFVPASDLLLVVGDGLLGITCEGAIFDGPPGFRRETLDAATLRLKTPADGGEDEGEGRSESGKRRRKDRDREKEKGTATRRRSRGRSRDAGSRTGGRRARRRQASDRSSASPRRSESGRRRRGRSASDRSRSRDRRRRR